VKLLYVLRLYTFLDVFASVMNIAYFDSGGSLVVVVSVKVFLRAPAATAVVCLSHRNSVCLSVRLSVHLSVHHTGGSVKNGAS